MTKGRAPGRRVALSRKLAELEAPRPARGNAVLSATGPGHLVSAAVEEMPDGIILVDMEGKVAYANRACERLLGYEASELIGTFALDLPTYSESKDRDRARDILRKVIGGGSTEAFDMTVVRKDGAEIPVSFTASVIGDAQGSPSMLIAVVRDVTERRLMDEALRESEELSRGMLDTAATGIYLLQDGCFRYVNRLFEEISGYAGSELVGTHSLDYVCPDDRDEVRAKAIDVLKGKSSEPYEFRFVRKDGQTIWVSDRLTSIWYRGKRSVLGTIADITERKKIETEVLEYTRQIEALFNVGATANRTLNIGELLNVVLDMVLGVMGAEAGGVFLVERESGELALRAYKGTSAEFASKVEAVRLGEGFTRRAALSKMPLVVEDIAADPRLGRMGALEEGLRSFCAVPIGARDELLGVIGIASHERRRFLDRDVRLLGAIANQIGMAIENAQLYEQALTLAFTDGLTGLYNRRYLMEQIEREFSRVERNKGTLSLVMIDLDGLKGINDRFGHNEGDVVLKQLGAVIKKNTRASDVAARWGGDEFMLLTHDTNSKGARRLAERIRSQVEREHPVIRGEEVCVSISVGIASYPGHAADVTQLLQRVDEAMYHAKECGGNRLRVFSSREGR